MRLELLVRGDAARGREGLQHRREDLVVGVAVPPVITPEGAGRSSQSAERRAKRTGIASLRINLNVPGAVGGQGVSVPL
jgi:hypothetical protein